MHFSRTADDPGGTNEGPRFHEGLEHRPIVRPTPKYKEMVQLTAHFVFPREREDIRLAVRMLFRTEALTIGSNGDTRSVGIDNNMVVRALDDSDESHAHGFPSMFTPIEHADESERKMQKLSDDLQSQYPDLKLLGFVADAHRTFYNLEMEVAANKQALLRNIQSANGTPLVELNRTGVRDDAMNASESYR